MHHMIRKIELLSDTLRTFKFKLNIQVINLKVRKFHIKLLIKFVLIFEFRTLNNLSSKLIKLNQKVFGCNLKLNLFNFI